MASAIASMAAPRSGVSSIVRNVALRVGGLGQHQLEVAGRRRAGGAPDRAYLVEQRARHARCGRRQHVVERSRNDLDAEVELAGPPLSCRTSPSSTLRTPRRAASSSGNRSAVCSEIGKLSSGARSSIAVGAQLHRSFERDVLRKLRAAPPAARRLFLDRSSEFAVNDRIRRDVGVAIVRSFVTAGGCRPPGTLASERISSVKASGSSRKLQDVHCACRCRPASRSTRSARLVSTLERAHTHRAVGGGALDDDGAREQRGSGMYSTRGSASPPETIP